MAEDAKCGMYGFCAFNGPTASTSNSRETFTKTLVAPRPLTTVPSTPPSSCISCTVAVVWRQSCPGRSATFAKLIEIDSAVSSRLAWEAFLGMAKPFPSRGVAQDGEPAICRPELDPGTPPAENGWKIYDNNKAAWVDAWTHYYEEKTTTNATRWAQYEKNKDNVQRRWRSATESRPSPFKSTKSAPATTKISFNLSVDTDIAAAARQWSKPERLSTPRPDGTLPKPHPCVFSFGKYMRYHGIGCNE